MPSQVPNHRSQAPHCGASQHPTPPPASVISPERRAEIEREIAARILTMHAEALRREYELRQQRNYNRYLAGVSQNGTSNPSSQARSPQPITGYGYGCRSFQEPARAQGRDSVNRSDRMYGLFGSDSFGNGESASSGQAWPFGAIGDGRPVSASRSNPFGAVGDGRPSPSRGGSTPSGSRNGSSRPN